MSRDGRPGPRTGGVRQRRTRLRRERSGLVASLRAALDQPTFGWGLTIALAFVAVAGALAAWSRERPLVAVGRIMDETALVRRAFQVRDIEGTEKERELERQRTPRVYDAQPAVFQTLQSALSNLPSTLALAKDLTQVDPEIRRQFGLTEDSLQAIRSKSVEGQATPEWTRAVESFMRELRSRPLLDERSWQRATQEGLSRNVELRIGTESLLVLRDDLLNLQDADRVALIVGELALRSGFEAQAAPAVVSRVRSGGTPTFAYNAQATGERQSARAERVPEKPVDVSVGQVIFRRGDVLTQAQLELYKEELRVFREAGEAYRLWIKRISVVGAVGAVTLAVVGYVALFCPRIMRNPMRMIGLGGVMLGGLAAADLATVAAPGLVTVTALVPTVFVAVLLAIAYDQRFALAMGVLHGLLVCVSLDQPVGLFAIMVTGVGAAIWRLGDIRDRRSLVGMGVRTGIALAVGTLVVGLIDRPIVVEQLWQTARDGAFAGAGGLLVGGVTLSVLPYIERTFEITTGLTLIELRDPKHPLLRELQQRAPGTYNHSLNVASLSEAAADAVGADSLLTYVGALYHDVGKLNKPDYFVENQSGRFNRHDKLSPAMSLLVIVGHIKDGLELAREFGLPRTLQHFIEAHHGTTLVEYFYHRALRQAEAAEEQGEEKPGPEEIEYRYPGPRPRTREVAIVMLADAVESTTRTMSEPTPARIEALVQELATKRLLDGQFDECDLTLKQLKIISDSIAKSVSSIHHGRIAYPSSSQRA